MSAFFPGNIIKEARACYSLLGYNSIDFENPTHVELSEMKSEILHAKAEQERQGILRDLQERNVMM